MRKDIISNRLTKFDYGATYPDAVMCLSLLQNLKYMALLTSNLKLVKRVSQLLEAAMNALKNMQIRAVRVWTIKKAYVFVMPHERKSANTMVIPITVQSIGLTKVVKISCLQLKDLDDAQEVISLLVGRGILPSNASKVVD